MPRIHRVKVDGQYVDRSYTVDEEAAAEADAATLPKKAVTVEQIRNCFTSAQMTAVLTDAQTDAVTNEFVFKLQTRSSPIPINDAGLLAGESYLDGKGLSTTELKALLEV